MFAGLASTVFGGALGSWAGSWLDVGCVISLVISFVGVCSHCLAVVSQYGFCKSAPYTGCWLIKLVRLSSCLFSVSAASSALSVSSLSSARGVRFFISSIIC